MAKISSTYVHIIELNCCETTCEYRHACPTGGEQIQRPAKRGQTKLIMTYPNAGMPQLTASTAPTIPDSRDMAAHIPTLLDNAIFPGCCGTTPDHIRAFRQAMDAHTSPS